MQYECEQCRGLMKYHKQTSKGEMYKCDSCGHTGYVSGMHEHKNGAGIDPTDFGL